MKKVIVFVMAVLVFSIVSINSYAYYGFLSEESNMALDRFKEKYGIYGYYLVSGEYYIPSHRGHIVEPSPFLNETVQLLREKYADENFNWGVIVPEYHKMEIQEYIEIIEGKVYTITEITIQNPQGPIRVIWVKDCPNNIPRMTIKH